MSWHNHRNLWLLTGGAASSRGAMSSRPVRIGAFWLSQNRGQATVKSSPPQSSACARNALLTEVNAIEKHKAFFEKFFERNGDYKVFIIERKNGVNPKYDKKKSRFGVVYGTILIFKQTELDIYLTKKGVKKSSND